MFLKPLLPSIILVGFVGILVVAHYKLVGVFNPSEKYESKWESSPSRVNIKTFELPPPVNPIYLGSKIYSQTEDTGLWSLPSFSKGHLEGGSQNTCHKWSYKY